MTAKCVLEVSG